MAEQGAIRAMVTRPILVGSAIHIGKGIALTKERCSSMKMAITIRMREGLRRRNPDGGGRGILGRDAGLGADAQALPLIGWCMERDLDVVVVCEINVDVVVAGLDGPPRFGAERTVEDVVLTAGSSGVLTATGLADLGLRVGICGLVGDDVFGRYMIDHCRRHQIDHAGVQVDARERTGASVSLSARDDRAILTHPGAMARFSYEQVRFEVIARARHLHLSSFFLQAALRPAVPALLQRAHALGLTTSCDTGHDPAERWRIGELLAGVDLFLPNEVEAQAISGAADAQSAAIWLAQRVPVVAVKCGAAGAWAARGAERVFVQGYAVQAVDTLGAGDAFDAGFLSAWLTGADLAGCARQGNACGALTAAHLGGTGALDQARVRALLEQGAHRS
jgi:sugar/nucleoside kinase (ribokinase family)